MFSFPFWTKKRSAECEVPNFYKYCMYRSTKSQPDHSHAGAVPLMQLNSVCPLVVA